MLVLTTIVLSSASSNLACHGRFLPPGPSAGRDVGGSNIPSQIGVILHLAISLLRYNHALQIHKQSLERDTTKRFLMYNNVNNMSYLPESWNLLEASYLVHRAPFFRPKCLPLRGHVIVLTTIT